MTKEINQYGQDPTGEETVIDWKLTAETRLTEIERLKVALRQISRTVAEGFHTGTIATLGILVDHALDGDTAEPPIWYPVPGEDHPDLRKVSDSVKPFEGKLTLEPPVQHQSGVDFDKDLAHLDSVRKTMADMKRYGSLQGIPMQEAEFLLSFIDNLWREHSRTVKPTYTPCPSVHDHMWAPTQNGEYCMRCFAVKSAEGQS